MQKKRKTIKPQEQPLQLPLYIEDYNLYRQPTQEKQEKETKIIIIDLF